MVANDSLRLAQSNEKTFDPDGLIANPSPDLGAQATQTVVDTLADAGVSIVGTSSAPVVTGDPTGTQTADPTVDPNAPVPVPVLVNVAPVPPVTIAPIDFGQAVNDIIQANPNPFMGTPQQPSAPVVTPMFAGLVIAWDGYNANGTQEKVPDWDHLEVHVSTTGNFTPTVDTLATTIQAGGAAATYQTTAYGVEQYVRFVAVSRSGARSVASAISMAEPLKLEQGDIGFDIATTQTFMNNTHFLF